MQLVLSWPVRLFIVAVLAFSIFVDGAGYIYRIANHYPLTGNVPGLPPNIGGWQSGLETYTGKESTSGPEAKDEAVGAQDSAR